MNLFLPIFFRDQRFYLCKMIESFIVRDKQIKMNQYKCKLPILGYPLLDGRQSAPV